MSDVRIISPEFIEQLIGARDVGGQPEDRVRDDSEIGTLPESRTPFVMSCTKWMMADPQRYIVWRVNPREVTWTMALRQVDRKMQGGVASHVWRDKVRGTFFDEPVLRMTFQSGNIMPMPTAAQVNKLRGAAAAVRAAEPAAQRSSADMERVAAQRTKFRADARIAIRDKEIAQLRGAMEMLLNTPATGGTDLGLQDRQDAIASLSNQIDTLEAEKTRIFERTQAEELGVVINEQAAAKNKLEQAQLAQIVGQLSIEKPLIPPGLFNFYQFLDMLDEDRIITDENNPTFGRQNLVYIMYNSNIFPQLTLTGIFTPEGTGWTDSASDPFQVDAWNASFTVHGTSPKMSMPQLAAMFQEIGFRRGIG